MGKETAMKRKVLHRLFAAMFSIKKWKYAGFMVQIAKYQKSRVKFSIERTSKIVKPPSLNSVDRAGRRNDFVPVVQKPRNQRKGRTDEIKETPPLQSPKEHMP
uniref:Uncharacterized protein n=1 Tax=Melanopsichium pennsylvanicum 4 TaxID=1398559 RepID=A0A077RCQ6_9BASI|nr:uncharacterized protein BN887_06201 [Melanopsichium pennsylvanicum 4]